MAIIDQHTDIELACQTMLQGGLILYPTDTVWGIGCDATNAGAVARVYALKQRDDSKAMITLVSSVSDVERLCPTLGDEARQLLDGIDGRPTTVVLDVRGGLASNLLAADGSAGIRITRESFSSALCKAFGRPIISTSANLSGEPAAVVYSDISQQIVDGVDYVCCTRRDDERRSSPSVVVKVEVDGRVSILRK